MEIRTLGNLTACVALGLNPRALGDERPRTLACYGRYDSQPRPWSRHARGRRGEPASRPAAPKRCRFPRFKIRKDLPPINGGDAEIANARLDQELFGARAAAVDGSMSLALRMAVCAGLLSRCCVCDMHVGMGMGDTFMYEYHLLHQIVSSPNPLAHGESSSPSLADPAFGFYTSVPRRGGRGGYLGLSSRGSAPMHIVSDDEDAFRDRARLELASGAESTQTDRADRPQLVIEHVR